MDCGLGLQSSFVDILLSFDFFSGFHLMLFKLWVFRFLLRSMLFLLRLDRLFSKKDGGSIKRAILSRNFSFALIVQKFLSVFFQRSDDLLYDFIIHLLLILGDFFRRYFWAAWDILYLFRLIKLLWKIIESLLNFVGVSFPPRKNYVQTLDESSGRRCFDLGWRNIHPTFIKLLKIDKKLLQINVFVHSIFRCFSIVSKIFDICQLHMFLCFIRWLIREEHGYNYFVWSSFVFHPNYQMINTIFLDIK